MGNNYYNHFPRQNSNEDNAVLPWVRLYDLLCTY